MVTGHRDYLMNPYKRFLCSSPHSGFSQKNPTALCRQVEWAPGIPTPQMRRLRPGSQVCPLAISCCRKQEARLRALQSKWLPWQEAQSSTEQHRAARWRRSPCGCLPGSPLPCLTLQPGPGAPTSLPVDGAVEPLAFYPGLRSDFTGVRPHDPTGPMSTRVPLSVQSCCHLKS